MIADALFTPFTFKGLTLKNRVVMAPMTRNFAPGGVLVDEAAAYYRRRAEGGVGLIISEGAGVRRPRSLHEPSLPQFHGVAALSAWGRVIGDVHAVGGLMAPQLWHVGAAPTPNLAELMGTGSVPAGAEAPRGPVDSPSGFYHPAQQLADASSEEDIADAIAAFAEAARAAKTLGFDAVELHGAHGYLIDQFFWAPLNRRDDIFGGSSLPQRSQFAIEILRSVRAAVGPEFSILLRVSQWKLQDYRVKLASTPAEMEAWLGPLAEAGADLFDCSQRRFWEPEFEGSDLNLAGWAKKLTGKPTITVGSVGLSGEFMGSITERQTSSPASLDDLVRRLERGDFDLVAVGRALLQDPHWVSKIREDRREELMTYDPAAMSTLW
jgi:2,4-dienoyl-CoA reductase-like NADH-dependent reductase (Old Yellow Enzyme family)